MFELIIMLAVWRLTSLLVDEYGPGDVFEKIREWLSSIGLGMFDCFWCASLWVSFPFAIMSLGIPVNLWWLIIYWLGFSGGAIIVETIVSSIEALCDDDSEE